MKSLFVCLVFVSCFMSASAQSFEGKITYANTFTSKVQGLSGDRLGIYIGTKQDYFIKGGRYKSMMNGQMNVMQLYDNKSNKIFDKQNASDTLYWLDASVNDDSMVSFEVKTSGGSVLGNPCSVLIVKTKAGTTEFYYNSKYKLDAAKFAKHQYGNWAFYCLKAGAVPLKTIIDNKQLRMESVAIAIKPSILPDATFNVDAGTPVKRMQ